ncbi:MAG: HlyD family efflux transporter periplasmic adaptor subunit [Planctomycetales bacterium]|nr:HlyD family efflux transporter periplasmic adaptor subunit [Planctomycetales bacterium]
MNRNVSQTSSGNIVSKSLPFMLLLIGIAGLIGFVALREPPPSREVGRQPPLVEVGTVKPADNQLSLEVDGEVVPSRQTTLASQVAGRIEKKSSACQAGNYVAKGTLLLQIDPSDYDLAIQRIQESVAQANVSLEEIDVEKSNLAELVQLAETDIRLQDREIKRIETLMAKNASSQADLDTVLRAEIQTRTNLQSLRNQASLLETKRSRLIREKESLLVQLEQATLDRKRTTITAPMDGVITDDIVEEDDFVQPGTALVQLEDTSKVEVRFQLKLDELQWLWAGRAEAETLSDTQHLSYRLPPAPVMVSMEVGGQTYEWDAVLARYDGAGINVATRTVPCIAEVANPRGGRLKSTSKNLSSMAAPPVLLRGTFVNLRIEFDTPVPLLSIPLQALRLREYANSAGSDEEAVRRNCVWKVEDGKLKVVSIDIAEELGNDILLFAEGSELREGDTIITSPLSLAVDSMQVRQASDMTSEQLPVSSPDSSGQHNGDAEMADGDGEANVTKETSVEVQR